MPVCGHCEKSFETVNNLRLHNMLVEGDMDSEFSPFFTTQRVADASIQYKCTIGNNEGKLLFDLTGLLNLTRDILTKIVIKHGYLHRYQMQIILNMGKIAQDGEVDVVPAYFTSTMFIPHDTEQLTDMLTTAEQQILAQIETFQSNGSGFSVLDCVEANILFAEYHPVRYGCDSETLPRELESKCPKTIRSIKNNNDKKCFEWSVLQCLHPSHRYHNRVSKYARYGKRYMFPKTFPVTRKDIESFCKHNPEIALNIVQYHPERKSFYPLRCDKSKKVKKQVNLLAINNHFYAIMKFNRLLNITRNNAVVYCKNCLNAFETQTLLDNHEQWCHEHKEIKLNMPIMKPFVKFNDFHRTILTPYYLILDIESILSVDNSTRKKHILSAYGLALIRSHDSKIIQFYCEFGVNAAELLVKSIQKCLNYIKEHTPNEGMIYTAEDRRNFNVANHCAFCNEEFDNVCYIKCRHHDHASGRFITALCRRCNLKAKYTSSVYCIVHNLAYDICSFIRELRPFATDRSPFVIASSTEKIRYLRFGNTITFVDSMHYVQTSLAKLVENHRLSGLKFACLKQIFKEHADDFNRKGVFPYNAMSDWSSYDQTELPERAAFYNDIEKVECSEEDYAYAQYMWQKQECKTMKDYLFLYLKADVCQLADCLTGIRNVLYENYGMDIFQFVSLPQFAFSSALKMTQVTLGLFTHVDHQLLVERAIRGGICQQSIRHIVANNEQCPNFDPSKPISNIILVDAVQLYGHSMSQPLPTGGYEWNESVTIEDILRHAEDDPIGYLVECDLEYPKEIHTATRELPLAPAHETVHEEMLSAYQKSQREKHHLRGTPEKLLLTCSNKENYVLHYRLLQLYVQLGMKVTKLHRVLQFTQSPFLKLFVERNQELRNQAKTLVGKDMPKLISNSFFGKCLFNYRLMKLFKLAFTLIQFEKNSRKLTTQRIKLLGNDIALFEHSNVQFDIKFPTIIGCTILDLSKLHMYKSYYLGFKARMTELSLAYMDTDSFCLYSRSPNFLDETKTLAPDMLDGSNLPKTHPLYSEANRGRLGFFKIETSDIAECVFLKPKMYSIRLTNDEQIKKAKGIQKSTVNRVLRYDMYLSVLKNDEEMIHPQTNIRAINLVNYNIESTKKSLSNFDDKRFMIDSVRSTPYHYCGSPPPALDYYGVE